MYMLRYAAQNVQFARTPLINILDHVTKKGGPESQCWLYTGRRDRHGVGLIQIDGVWREVRRVAYSQIYHINLPENVEVVNLCGEGCCWNPNHLNLSGTAYREMSEAVRMVTLPKPKPARGTQGSNVGTSKLTEEQVKAIREEYAAGGVFQKDLAAKYGVSQGTVCRLIKGTNWAQV